MRYLKKQKKRLKRKLSKKLPKKAGIRHVLLAGHLILATSHAGGVTIIVTGPLHAVWAVIHGLYEVYDVVKTGVRALFGKNISIEESIKKKNRSKVNCWHSKRW